jgi:hypothetical protein
MSTSTYQDTTSSSSSGRTSSIKEETNIKPVSYYGGKYCYSIGGLVGQEFSRMEKPTKRKWSDYAPRWRVATGGLNLEGK